MENINVLKLNETYTVLLENFIDSETQPEIAICNDIHRIIFAFTQPMDIDVEEIQQDLFNLNLMYDFFNNIRTQKAAVDAAPASINIAAAMKRATNIYDKKAIYYISNSIHTIIYQFTQVEDTEYIEELREEIVTLNLIYNFFKSIKAYLANGE